MKELEKEDKRDKERHWRKKPERTWANWLPGYLIYCGVIVKVQSWRALLLVQYLDIIYRLYVDFPGYSWLLYDQGI